MKAFKGIFYGICILLLLCCAAVGIFALNPELTQRVAGLLPKENENVTVSGPDETTGADTETTGAAAETGTDAENETGAAGDSLTETQQELINPNPQEPLSWEDSRNDAEEEDGEMTPEERLEEAGITEDEVLDTMEAYYADCLEQLKKAGAGDIQFTNVIPETLWPEVERAYTDNSFRKGYVEKALEELKMEEFAIQLQAQRLGGGYYRLYHNIATWN